MAKGEVEFTYANAHGIWFAGIEAAEGNGEQEVYGCTWQTVRKRAAKAIREQIKARQGQEPTTTKVEYLGLNRLNNGKMVALFREC